MPSAWRACSPPALSIRSSQARPLVIESLTDVDDYGSLHHRQTVVPTPALYWRCVRTASGAPRVADARAIEQPLAFVAPTPVALTPRAASPVGQAVIRAAALRRRRMRAASRTAGIGDARAIEQSPAPVAPTPIALQACIAGVVRQAVVGTATLSGWCVRAASRARGARELRAIEQPLTLVAPAPVALHAYARRDSLRVRRPANLVDLTIGSTVHGVMGVRACDDERRWPVCGEGRPCRERDVNVRWQSTGDYPEFVKVIVRASVDVVLGVGASAVIRNRVARRQWSTRVCGHIPMADRLDAAPPQFVDVPIGAAVGHLMLVVVAGVVSDGIARRCRCARDCSQVVVFDRIDPGPVQPVNVPIIAAINDDVVAGVGVDERRRITGAGGAPAGMMSSVAGASSMPFHPRSLQVVVSCSVDHDVRAVLLDESDRIAGGRRRTRCQTEGVAADRASRPVEAVDMVVLVPR